MLETKVVQVTGRGSNVNLDIDDSTPFDEVLTGVRNHLSANPFMYSSGTITVNVGRRMINKEELTQIKELLEKQSGVTVSRFWCPPDILEQALSENVGFGVAMSAKEKPPRQEASSGGIAHNDPRFTSRSSPTSDIPGPEGMEQWSAYILEPLQNAAPEVLVEASTNDDASELAAEASDQTAEYALTVEVDSETGAEVEQEDGAEVADEEALVDAAPSKGKEGRGQSLPDRPSATGIGPKLEPAGLNRGNEALLIKTNCRSGEVIRYPGDVVVMADVNPGGQIIADGDILVFGNLRGFAHAGASGDIQATIIALNLETHRLQIGPYTGVDPKPKKRSKSNKSNPRIAYVRRRSVYVAPYAGRFGGYSGGTLYDG